MCGTSLRKNVFLFLIMTGIIMTAASCASQEAPSDSPSKEETRYVSVAMEGGTGKASIASPAEVRIRDGAMEATLVWSSPNYDYMIVDGTKYENENSGGNSTFTIPLPSLEEPLSVIADTVAMSTPHEIEYILYWGDTAGGEAAASEGESEEEAPVTPDNKKETSASLTAEALEQAGFTETGELSLSYAEGFRVRFFGDYALISIENSGEYLLVPEDLELPEGMPDSTVILKKPLDHAYLVSSSAADLIDKCGALDFVTLTGVKESDWHIDSLREAMEKGSLIYAGRYRAPDYEQILEAGCDLAIENTMIYHEPAVKEKLEELGIPVLVETSSYETHPLGRLEWIKLYGILFGRYEEAEAYFDEQAEVIGQLLKGEPDTGQTAAFFHVTAGGLVNVRRPGDYVTKMIELAGGQYVPASGGGDGKAVSSMNMQMEEFYRETADADVLIYNSTIGGEIGSIDELLEKSPLFKDFKAVREDRVYCTERNFFQQISGMAEFILDLDAVFRGEEREFAYLNKLE